MVIRSNTITRNVPNLPYIFKHLLKLFTMLTVKFEGVHFTIHVELQHQIGKE